MFSKLNDMSTSSAVALVVGATGALLATNWLLSKKCCAKKTDCCSKKTCNCSSGGSCNCGSSCQCASSSCCAKKESNSINVSAGKDDLHLPVIDLAKFFNHNNDIQGYLNECNKLANALHDYGAVVVKDPRVDEADNNTYLDMMEAYFEQSDGKTDARPQFHFQVGVTPEFTERARDKCSLIGAYGPDNKPLSPCPPEYDAKWRFFWRVGPRPTKTNFADMNMMDVVPAGFPQWESVMDLWGKRMLAAVFTLSEMAATGLGLEADAFVSRMENGPHLLAPTGSDFNRYGAKNTILAGFHSDLNFFTIHGKSRFPGLFVWTRDGTKKAVRVPDGCLLVQAGQQIEYLTGGYVLAGFHEVVVTDATISAIHKRKLAGQSLWRVSSTLFSHVASDQVMQPVGRFNNELTIAKYPPILAGDYVKKELDVIKLKK